MGLDPGYRTGCKVAVVDPSRPGGGPWGDPGDPERSPEEGSGSPAPFHDPEAPCDPPVHRQRHRSYETEQFAASLIQAHHLDVHYLITNEAGASVYSASKLAQEELPEYDVTIRGAVSLARRVQDPLAELVKIDPQAIGVGQYQHDVDQKALTGTLDGWWNGW